MKPDLELQRDVLDHLEWEPSIDAASIGVTASEGVITLTGHVSTFDEKLLAEQTSQQVHGVKAVANELEVKPLGAGVKEDAHIASAAVKAIEDRTTIPEERVKVAVSKGWITLQGEVEWFFQKASAEAAVRHIPGVRGLLNEIVVKPKASALNIKSRIEAAFRRTAELDSQGVHVETEGSTVTLLGNVSSWSERQEAERMAWCAPGVSSVKNLIKITPYVTAYSAP